MKKTIRDYELKGKKIIIRVDFNVPIKDNTIIDDNRIKESLPTIKYATNNGAKVILMSHLGRIKTKDDLAKNSLKIVADRLSDLLNTKVIFISETRGEKLDKAVNNLQPSEVLLIENTRYEDLNGQKESSNDESLAKYWASLGDIFINDAFGTSHRKHASNVGIASFLPSGIGFLIEKELKALEKVVNNPLKPLTIILGGAKVSDKIGLIQNLVKKADYILLGGGMAFTFLKAMGYEIGSSLLDDDSLSFCSNILKTYNDKIIVPVDIIEADEISDNANINIVDLNSIRKIGIDMGPKTIALFKNYLEQSNTIVWNGPIGMFEYDKFSKGTIELCNILASSKAFTIVGGGDTGAAIMKYGLKEKINHVSTGGGATLEFLEGKNLPGIEIINNI